MKNMNMKRGKCGAFKKVEGRKREKEMEENGNIIEKKTKIKKEEGTEKKTVNYSLIHVYHYSFIEKQKSELKKKLLDWYYKYKRKLPWRNDEPPYSTSIQMKAAKSINSIESYFTKKEQNKNGDTLKNTSREGSEMIREEETKHETKQETNIGIEKKVEKTLNETNETDENDLSLKGYRIYISEIMLQQTRVPTVLAYYLAWMKKWKNIFDLANSDLNEILKLWKGLGYYNRAKNLFECCKIVVNKYNGIFPNDLELLKQLPGIGSYTAKAICIHLYNMKDICVDTNIVRIFSRITDVINYYNSAILNKHCDSVSSILCKDEDKCSDLSQALMDLGSSLCNNSPQCSICPINKHCLMYLRNEKKTDTASSLLLKHSDECELCIKERYAVEIKNVPLVKIKKKTDKICLVLLIKKVNISEFDECYLMKKNTDTNLFSMHYLFPFLLLNQLTKNDDMHEYLKQLLIDLQLNSKIIPENSFTFINSFKHKFSHLTYDTRIYLCSVSESSIAADNKNYVWVKLKDVQNFTHNTFCQTIVDFYKRHIERKTNIFKKIKK